MERLGNICIFRLLNAKKKIGYPQPGECLALLVDQYLTIPHTRRTREGEGMEKEQRVRERKGERWRTVTRVEVRELKKCEREKGHDVGRETGKGAVKKKNKSR